MIKMINFYQHKIGNLLYEVDKKLDEKIAK